MDIDYIRQKQGDLIESGYDDQAVTEMSFNPDENIWFTYRTRGNVPVGTMRRPDALAFCNAVAHYSGQFLNENNTSLDTILPFNGARIHIDYPPMVDFASFTIRKHSPAVFTLQEYEQMNVITHEQASVLRQAIKDKKNILISGGPGAGKTTLMNALLKEMAFVTPDGHRVLLLEDTKELKCEIKNSKAFLTNKNDSMRQLLWNAMRNSPDSLMVGEVRDGACLDMLKAMNTGCKGCMATIHANSAKGAMQRVLDLAQEATHIPPFSLMVEAIDMVVQIVRDPNTLAGRRVTEIVNIEGYDRAKNEFVITKAA